jgi:general stress protein CsbA
MLAVCVLPPLCVPLVVLNSAPTFSRFVGLLMCLALVCLMSMRAVLGVFLHFSMGAHG